MEQKTYDVFISYSRKDYVDEHNNVIPGNEVSKIKEALTKAGITYWFDEEGVYAGDKFAKVIVRNIKASSIFVFLSTKNSNQSEWTANEISTAHMLGKKIIPVRIDDSVFHDDVILYIARLSRIDYFNNPVEGRRELIRSIKDYMEEVKAVEAQKAVDEQRRKEELERQRRQQEEEKKRQARIEKIETDIAALESQRIERKKAVLQKEQELKLAQIDLDVCEAKIQKLQDKLQELREPKKEVEEETIFTIRLSKAAKEFNLGKDTIVEFLTKKGFRVDSSPNTKLTGEMYALLVKEYQSEKEVKNEAMRLAEVKYKAEEKRRLEESSSKERVFAVGEASFKMIRVEGGSMGTFYIGETQVTQALWQAVMGNNPSHIKGLDHPVEYVSWNDICGEDGKGTDPNCFLYKLNQKTGKDFRLPKETEWEYAAKGGNKSNNYTYAGSDNIDKVAWYWKNSGDNYLKGSDEDWDNLKIEINNCKTHSVKQLSPNELGIYDMSGNVWEWCEDLHEPSGSIRVLRGGSWGASEKYCRISGRVNRGPNYRSKFIGFRLVLPR